LSFTVVFIEFLVIDPAIPGHSPANAGRAAPALRFRGFSGLSKLLFSACLWYHFNPVKSLEIQLIPTLDSVSFGAGPCSDFGLWKLRKYV
jgi:hypothetical protein